VRPSFGQLIAAGFDIAEAKQRSPLCRRCAAKLARYSVKLAVSNVSNVSNVSDF
jgi:hypothetical protein